MGQCSFECLEFVPGGSSGFRLAGVIDSFFWRTAPWSSTNPQVSRGFWARPRRPGSRPFMHQVEEEFPALEGLGLKSSRYCFCQKNNYTF